MRPKKIARKYLSEWFCLDFLCVGTEMVVLVMQSSMAGDVVGLVRFGKIARVTRLMRLLRLLRAVKVAKLMNAIAEFVHSQSLMTMLGVLRTVVGILVTCHYLACGWYMVGSIEYEQGWMERLHREDIGYVYLSSLHWSITQFTPASMEVNPQNCYERVFAILVIVIGLVAFSSFVSSITAAMSALHKQRELRMKQTGDIRRYIVENRLSLHLGSSIMAFMKAYDFTASMRLHEAAALLVPEPAQMRHLHGRATSAPAGVPNVRARRREAL